MLRAARTSLAAAALSLAAVALPAQQMPASRFAPSAPSVEPSVSAAAALDSAARYTRVARGQRATGATLGLLGGAGAAAAYAGWVGSGRMGMNEGQAVALTAGVAAIAMGWDRWRHAHESDARARRWAAQAAVATRP